MHHPPRMRRGYTLIELLVVVALFATIATLAMIMVTRTRGQNDVSAFARAISNRVTIARRRAVATKSPFLVDVRANSVAYCQQANAAQIGCPTPGLESDRPFVASSEATVLQYATATDIGQSPPHLGIGAGKSLLVLPSGSSDSDVSTPFIPDGITYYLQGVNDTSKHYLVAVYPLATRPRVTDKW